MPMFINPADYLIKLTVNPILVKCKLKTHEIAMY